MSSVPVFTLRMVFAGLAIWLPFAWTATMTASAQNQSEESEALRRVKGYELSELFEDDQRGDLKLVPKSLLNWSNPVFGTTDGGIFLWVTDERPSVLMKTYKTRNGRWFEQIRSFSTRRVIARESPEGEVFWSPDRGAGPMKRLPGSPRPAATEIARLVQMKAMHRKFTAKGDIEGAGGDQELRRYPRPLYRYKGEEVVDGAMLAFAQGTGPDVILMLEARRAEEDVEWHYRLGSIGIFAVDVSYEGEPVWSEPRRTAPDTKPTDLYDGRRLAL